MSKNVSIISCSVDARVLAALNKYAAKSPFSRSTLITIAVAQLVGIPYEPPRKEKDDDE